MHVLVAGRIVGANRVHRKVISLCLSEYLSRQVGQL